MKWMIPWVQVGVTALGLCAAASPAFAIDEARVLILNGLDPYLPAYLAVDEAMRANLVNDTTKRVVYYSESLDAQRFPVKALEAEFLTLLSKKYSALRIDLVVAVSRPAIEFFERHGEQLWPGARVVYQVFPSEYAGPVVLPPNATGVVGSTHEPETIALAQRLQPNARRIVVITGVAAADNIAEQLARNALSTRAQHATVEFLSGLPLQELLVRVAAEPADSIIIYLSEFRDRDGRPYTPREVLRAISKSARAPVYGIAESYVGYGMTAGIMESFEDRGRLVAEQVHAALAQAPFDPSRVLLKTSSRCFADARALKRWSLDERQLPVGCEIRFADRSVWRQYGSQIATAVVIFMGQTVTIMALIVQRRRRRLAEEESQKRFSEMAHMNRRVSLGEMSASIAHELNQPLGAIRNNVAAAELFIKADPPRLREVAEILGDIKRDDQRASDIVGRIREMLLKTDVAKTEMDLNEVIQQTEKMLAGEASSNGVLLEIGLEAGLPRVNADRIQIQQVVINLALNAMEAMSEQSAENKVLRIRSRRANDKEAEVSVVDSGTGIPSALLARIFDPFITTSAKGMGLGLAISRTIIEAHGGSIRAENGTVRGAILRFTLPFAAA
jgi:signal transduction histidine kinase